MASRTSEARFGTLLLAKFHRSLLFLFMFPMKVSFVFFWFNIKNFHDTLLGNGALPLTMVEAEIDRYIDASR